MGAALLAIALAATASSPNASCDGGDYAAGGQYILAHDRPVAVRSPDARWAVVADRPAPAAAIGPAGRVALDGLVGLPGGQEVLWSPDSRYFVVNESDGGAVGTYVPHLYGVGAGVRRHDERFAGVRAEARSLPHDCDGPEAPNISVSGFLAHGREMLVIAQVPDHSVCRNMGALRGYRVSTATGAILERIGAGPLRRRYRRELGCAFR